MAEDVLEEEVIRGQYRLTRKASGVQEIWNESLEWHITTLPAHLHWSFGKLRIDLGKLRSMEALFAGRHFDREVIVLCVRWYLRYKLSFRDLVEMMSERGLRVAHTTIMRWVQRFAPEFTKRWNRFGKSRTVVASRRNLYQGSGPVDLPL